MEKITRRDFLKYSGFSLGALSFPGLFTACSSGGAGLSSSPISRDLHFSVDFGGFLSPDENFILHAGGQRYSLNSHTPETRERMNVGFAASHFAEQVSVPGDRAMHIYVTQRSDRGGEIAAQHGTEVDHGLALTAIQIPDGAEILPGSTASEVSSILRAERQDAADASAVPAILDFNTIHSLDLAIAIIFHHQNLMALDANIAKTILAHIRMAPGIIDLQEKIQQLGRFGWYTKQPMLTDGDVPKLRASDGEVIYQYVIKPEVNAAATLALQNSLNAVNNDPALQNLLYSGELNGNVERGEKNVTTTIIPDSKKSIGTRSQTVTVEGVTYTLASEGKSPGLNFELEPASDGQITLEFSNIYIRHLSAFVEFLDVDNNVVEPQGWTSLMHNFDQSIRDRLETNTRKFLTVVAPPPIFFGAGVKYSQTAVTFHFPKNATSARLLVGGLGNGGPRNDHVEEIGVALTSVFEIGVPSILLAATAGYHKSDGQLNKIFTASLFSTVIRLYFDLVWSHGNRDHKTVLTKAAIFLGNILFKKGLQALLDYVLENEATSIAEEAVPFVGWALNAVSILTTATELATTTADVVKSPRIIEEEILATHTVRVTINHDTDDFEFPATATHFDVFLEFSNAKRVEQKIELPGTTVSDPIVVEFPGVPFGGTVKVVTYFYSNTDWIAGRAEKAGIQNGSSGILDVQLTLQEQIVPLSSNTQYSHKERITSTNNAFAWQAGAAPSATKLALNSNAGRGNLASLVATSVNQTLGRMSYSWQSDRGAVSTCGGGGGSLGYAYRTIGLTQNPNEGVKFSGCYGTAPSLVQNALFTSPPAEQNSAGVRSLENILVKPISGGRYAVTLFSLEGGTAYNESGIRGIFPLQVDAVRILPRNVVMGISRAYQKLFYLRLANEDTAADLAPEATLLSGPALSSAGVSTNPSLLLAPVTLALGLGQTVLVLEVNPNQSSGSPVPGMLRAFNSRGEAIGYFGNKKAHRIQLKNPNAAVTYLDMTVEAKGYIYILSHRNSGEIVDDYVLEIYRPDGSFLSQTTGLAAARFSLDAWRNVYSLNYESIIAPSGDTEPSVSQWIPSTPEGQEQTS